MFIYLVKKIQSVAESENQNNEKYIPKGQMPPHPSRASFPDVQNRNGTETSP